MISPVCCIRDQLTGYMSPFVVVNENVADGVGSAIKMTHVRRFVGADGCVGNVVQIKVAGEESIGGVLSIVDLCGKSL